MLVWVSVCCYLCMPFLSRSWHTARPRDSGSPSKLLRVYKPRYVFLDSDALPKKNLACGVSQTACGVSEHVHVRHPTLQGAALWPAGVAAKHWPVIVKKAPSRGGRRRTRRHCQLREGMCRQGKRYRQTTSVHQGVHAGCNFHDAVAHALCS